jgi:O-methyltransferase involved in polyketide biosynthesis
MQANRSSRTAEFMALFRALETRSRPRERRLFEDPLARRLLEDLGADDYRRRYWGDHADELKGYAFYRAVLAEVTGAA